MNTSTNLTRAMTYLERMPAAIAGSGGDKATFQVAIACKRFGLTEREIWDAMRWFNDNRCSPPWSEKELRHKMSGVLDLVVKKPLGRRSGYRSRSRTFVAPPPPHRPPVVPVCQRSEAEEEAWWGGVADELGMTLDEFDARCGVTK